MAEYIYTGAVPRLLFGLSQGVNAHVAPADPDAPELAPGQTIVIQPGDRLVTDEDYVHAELEPVETDAPPAEPAPKKTTARTKA